MEANHHEHLPHVITKLPNGQTVDLIAFVEHQSLTEAQISIELAEPGDILAFQYTDEAQETPAGFTFEIEDMAWHDLGISGVGAPKSSVTGRISGSSLPAEVDGARATYQGSGWGGSIRQQGTVATGRAAYFYITGENHGLYISPFVDNFQIFRKDDTGDFQSLSPNVLDRNKSREIASHKDRLIQAEALMKRFGFDAHNFRDGTVTVPEDPAAEHPIYEDERYRAEYQAHMAMGNQLAILDKQTGKWTEFKYTNYENADVLQVAFADLSNCGEVFDFLGITAEYKVHRTRAGITTHVTSSRLGLDAINYRPGNRELREVFSAPQWGAQAELVRFDLQLLPELSPHIDVQFPFTEVVRENPDFLEALKTGLSVTNEDDGSTTVLYNGRLIRLANPDTEISEIVHNLDIAT